MPVKEITSIDKKKQNIDTLNPRDFIIIKGARVNNLKNISLAIPRNQLVVITGLSGSGKSSLAFDTLFAEGQRMYVESLSAYARQFLGRMEKPEVDYIKGISPAIAIEQKVITKNPRSTVGTTTEIYDYLKLLFARIGITYSPISGEIVKKDTIEDVIAYLHTFEEGQKVMILAPLKPNAARTLEDELKILLQKGFTRIFVEKDAIFIEEIIENKKELAKLKKKAVYILIDRTTIQKEDQENIFRLSDSLQTAFFEGEGDCLVEVIGVAQKAFSNKFELDGITFEEPTLNFFTFNNPYGACKTCEGFGNVLGISEDLVIPNKTLSVFEGAVQPWRSDKMNEDWLKPFAKNAIHEDFPIHRSYEFLSDEEKSLLWDGNKNLKGIRSFFTFIESQLHKIQYRVMLSRYKGKTVCPDCRGTRLRKDAGYVKINQKSIQDLALMSVEELIIFFDNLNLSEHQQKIAHRILIEIKNRLAFIDKVGLNYLTINRLTSTLSGGEFQRIKLATSLGSALVGSMYILDEPSIGLHPRDTEKLVEVLLKLKALGNTVIIVEHEEEIMRAADQIIDIGPDAGSHGGELIFQGSLEEIMQSKNDFASSHTLRFLKGIEQIPVPTHRRTWTNAIEIKNAHENNLKNVHVKFPLGILTAITGVSGSGKSTLVKKILYPALGRALDISVGNEIMGKFSSIEGDIDQLNHVEFINQEPIGKSSRSNPVTYIKAYDAIRELFANQPLSKVRGYDPGFFSFNVDKGRCDACQGEGTITVEMQFMANVHLTCEVCNGKRFKEETLEVTYKGKNIAEVLELTIDDSLLFFNENPKINDKIRPLAEVGLGYVRLGQSASTLSGGEAQRVKLASFLDQNTSKKGKNLFIFDEPTTGLHFHDIKKLLKSINALVEQGNTAILIEHNIDVIKCADWVIDLGPEGGKNGGYVTFEGLPEDLIKIDNNYTAKFLKSKL